jgi:sulfite reductase alpha subunit-like flavoprotein
MLVDHQDVAEHIGREAEARHYAVRVLAADSYLPAVAVLPSEPALLFVASTTGQGEQPSNMRQLWKFLLRKSLPPNSLTSVAAAVFGLGDSG